MPVSMLYTPCATLRLPVKYKSRDVWRQTFLWASLNVTWMGLEVGLASGTVTLPRDLRACWSHLILQTSRESSNSKAFKKTFDNVHPHNSTCGHTPRFAAKLRRRPRKLLLDSNSVRALAAGNVPAWLCLSLLALHISPPAL